MKVSDILQAKSPAIVTIMPTDTLGALSALLRERRIGAAIVSRDGLTIDGVISERDLAHGLAAHKGDLHALPVSALMTKTVITCGPDDDVGQVASTMLSRGVRHLPVVSGDRLLGMVSIRDVLGSRLDELQQQTALLRAYAARSDRAPEDR